MNVLLNAINQISKLHPSSQIIIKNNTVRIVDGVDFKSSVSITTIAQVQQLKGSEIQSNTTYTDSNDYRRFFIVGNEAKIVASALHDNYATSTIEYSGKIYNIYYREDWSLNGWIIIDAVCVGESDD